MSKIKSPFVVIDGFLSQKTVDIINSKFGLNKFDIDKDGYPLSYERTNKELDEYLAPAILDQLVPHLERHYDVKIEGVESFKYQSFPAGMQSGVAEAPHSESSAYVKGKWVKTHDRDLTAVIWLKTYADKAPVDPRIEVYGGRAEFPAYGFSLMPEAGSIVVHPAGPHFITATSNVLAGSLEQIRINFKVRTKAGAMWLYNPMNFPGKWNQWFEQRIT